MKIYDYIIVGGGISGSATAFELSHYTKNILLIDKLEEVAKGASGAAGAFLSPLLGKPNNFKDLITHSLPYAVEFYKKYTPDCIDNCGTIRIPKDTIDQEKFQSYIPYMDFPFEEKEDGYFFPIGSVVNSGEICRLLTKDIEKLFNLEITTITYQDDIWILNNSVKTKKLILATGANLSLLNEHYIDIRAVWGQRIDIETTTKVETNYHKECSVSRSIQLEKNLYQVSIGATHNRFEIDREVSEEDTKELLEKASDILKLENINVIKLHGGARAGSSDYFPIVGTLINSAKTIEKFPYLKNGTHVDHSRFERYENLYIINGVGGRGFVLAPYLAKQLVNHLIKNEAIDPQIIPDRLFTRWVKKQ